MQKLQVKTEISEQELDLDFLLPYIVNQDVNKPPYIDINKLDYLLREFNYHKEERRQIKKILKLYKNPQGYLTVEAFKNFFSSKDREEKEVLEEPTKPEDLAILFDMISSAEGSLSQEIDLKKMKEFTKSLNIDEDDDRSLSLMYKFARNSETGKLKKEDLVGLAKIFQKNKAL